MKKFRNFLNTKTKTIDQIAKKHKVSSESLRKQLEKGTKVEKEHSSNTEVSRKIALDHLNELPDYYDKLQKIEKH